MRSSSEAAPARRSPHRDRAVTGAVGGDVGCLLSPTAGSRALRVALRLRCSVWHRG